MKKLRPIAIYLPQFHPIEENDKWWGKGFTEWTNVVKAKPLFKGHYQPHLPADLGFYDLRVPEIREQQATLAREYGIHGFCYYHYWFNGKRMLERPFQEVFESGKPDFPFMLCWANENWTRTWDGDEQHILIAQKYSFEDDKKHIDSLIPYFKDKRYIRVDNKPVIAIYRSNLLPDAKRTLQIWRQAAAEQGLELYICRFENMLFFGKDLIESNGFDAAVDFQPLSYIRNLYSEYQIQKQDKSIKHKIKNRVYKKIIKPLIPALYNTYHDSKKRVIDYDDYVEFAVKQSFPDYKWFPCITPMWDNSARKNKYLLFKNATPNTYKRWLESLVKKFKPYSKDENLLFINAWNEWGEGNHLEPCKKWGRDYLNATKEVLTAFEDSE